MGSRKRKSQGGSSWGLFLGIGGAVLVLLIGIGAGVGFFMARKGSQPPDKTPSPGTPAPSEYDEWVTYEPGHTAQRTAWGRIQKVLIVDKWYRKLDRLHQELPPARRAASPADADAIILVTWDKVQGMKNAKGDGKFVTFIPVEMDRAKVVVINPRKEFYGEALLNPVGNDTSTTAANVIEFVDGLNRVRPPSGG
jgi:hypothetical protein